MTEPSLYLTPVRHLEDIDGSLYVVAAYAIVTPLLVDPTDDHRLLVRVVDGEGAGLDDGITASVELEQLLSLAQAEGLLQARRRRLASSGANA